MVYEFVRNDAFNARNYFLESTSRQYKKNDFGYNFGGPVYIPALQQRQAEDLLLLVAGVAQGPRTRTGVQPGVFPRR